MFTNKHILRQKFKAMEFDASDDKKIIDNAMNLIEKYNPRVVGIYIARSNEVDLLPMMLKCHNIICAMPKIAEDDQIFFVNYYPGGQLEPNEKYPNYFEPKSDNIIVPDLIFVPGVAFDMRGYRLGLGKGHYDKYLEHHKAIKIGVCRSENLIARLPKERHDVCMDYVITEDVMLSFV